MATSVIHSKNNYDKIEKELTTLVGSLEKEAASLEKKEKELAPTIEQIATIQDLILSKTKEGYALINANKDTQNPFFSARNDQLEKTLQGITEKVQTVLSNILEAPQDAPSPLIDRGIVPAISKHILRKAHKQPHQVKEKTTPTPGLRNSGGNSWTNTFFQMVVSIPGLERAYSTFANSMSQDKNNEGNRLHGQQMVAVLKQYQKDQLAKKEVSSADTQTLRLAFHHFFGYDDPLTGEAIFSASPEASEDVFQALGVLMEGYERIRARSPALPLSKEETLFTPVQTRCLYRPTGRSFPADAVVLNRTMENGQQPDSYAVLDENCCSNRTNITFQVLLDVQDKGHMPFEDIFLDYFTGRSTETTSPARFLGDDAFLHEYEIQKRIAQFKEVPKEFILTILRFKKNVFGQCVKIPDHVHIKRYLSLPALVCPNEKPRHYALDFFTVHQGPPQRGQYICYKKLNGAWFEFNNAIVSPVSDDDIDKILKNQDDRKGKVDLSQTSYSHHYRLVDAIPKAYTVHPAPISSNELAKSKSSLDKKVKMLKSLTRFLEKMDGKKKKEADLRKDLLKLAAEEPDIAKELYHLLWVVDKTPHGDPKYGKKALESKHIISKLQAIKIPLLSKNGKNILHQFADVLTKKVDLAKKKHTAQQLKFLSERLKDKSTPNDVLWKCYQQLPKEAQEQLQGLIYQSHQKKEEKSPIDDPKLKTDGVKSALEINFRETLGSTNKPLLSLQGKNILEQMAYDRMEKVEKDKLAFQRSQLDVFHDLLSLEQPKLTDEQLIAVFDKLDISKFVKQKLFTLVWIASKCPSIPNFGEASFKADPRCFLKIREPLLLSNISRSKRSFNILEQMMILMDSNARTSLRSGIIGSFNESLSPTSPRSPKKNAAVTFLAPALPKKPSDMVIEVLGLKNLKKHIHTDPEKLFQEAEQYFAEHSILAPKKFNIEINSSLRIFLENLFKGNPGICLGEYHGDSAPKYLLCTFAEEFVAWGCDTLYIEGYEYDVHQEHFDVFMRSRTANIPSKLEKRLESVETMLEDGRYYSDRDVVLAVKRAGFKRIICIDSSASQSVEPEVRNNGIEDINREAAMNYQALRIIENTAPSGKKYIVFAGSAHTSRVCGVPGLAQMLGVPSITVIDDPQKYPVLADKKKPASVKISLGQQKQESKSKRIYEDDYSVKITPALFPGR